MPEKKSQTNPSQPASDLDALRVLVRCAYESKESHFQAVMSHDWESCPRIHELLRGLTHPVTRHSLLHAVRRLFAEAVDDLGPSFPSKAGSINPLEAFRARVMEQGTWDSIQAELTEQGRYHAKNTLRDRVDEFLPFLLDWLRNETSQLSSDEQDGISTDAALKAGRESPPNTFATSSGSVSKVTGHWPRWAYFALFALLLLVLGGFLRKELTAGRTRATTQFAAVPKNLIGRMIPGIEGLQRLPSPFPPLALPSGRRPVQTGMAIEDAAGHFRFLISTGKSGENPGSLCLWDPSTSSIVWSTTFVPPADQRITHATVGSEVLAESYAVTGLYYAGKEGDLGDYVVAVMQQKYSPTFVAFVRLDTGKVAGYYVHPGYLEKGIVADIDKDGQNEVVLGGADNSLNRPVVLALKPGPWVGAASTVIWNSSGQEAAESRVLLPAARETLSSAHATRLATLEINEGNMDYRGHILTVGVGTPSDLLFHVRLGLGLKPVTQAPIVLWDEDVVSDKRLGITPDLEAWAQDIKFIEGKQLEIAR